MCQTSESVYESDDCISEVSKDLEESPSPIIEMIEQSSFIEKKPKIIVLSEANFIKPTIASKFKKVNIPLLPQSKPPKPKQVKMKKIVKQNTSRTMCSHTTINSRTKDIKNDLKLRNSSEIKLDKLCPPLNKFGHVESKVYQFRSKETVRSSSFAPMAKLFEEKATENENKVNESAILPSLGFKQALPELYQFVENYMPSVKKAERVNSASKVVFMPLAKNYFKCVN